MKLNKTLMFKIAHAKAKKAHVKGECYAITFGAALRDLYKDHKRAAFKHAKLRTWTSKDGAHCRAYPADEMRFFDAMQASGINCKSAWVNVDTGAMEFDGLRKYGKGGFDGLADAMQALAINVFTDWLNK